MTETAPVMREIALAYAGRGWRVFPLNGKVPAISKEEGGSGCLDATTDPALIHEWWGRSPHANVGIATGEASGILAIDLDGPEARRAWLDLCARHDPIATPWSRTGRADGGIHILLRWPDGEHVPNRPEGSWSERVLGARKIGVIGEGRYIVAPGSTHASGTRYAWGAEAERLPLAAVPAWLLALLRETVEPATTQRPTWRPQSERDATRARAYCLGALRHGHDAVASLGRGERNHGLVREAYGLGGYIPTGFLEEHEVREALRSACAHWPARERDVRKDFATIERGIHAGMSLPRGIPPQEEQRSNDSRAPAEVVPLGSAPAPERKWKTARELALELSSGGPPMPTHFSTLDDWTRGGLRKGKLVAIGGAPGAGKTALALQLGHVYHDAGHPVAIYAADEARDGLLGRWGQQCGLVREDIEAAHEPTRRALARFFDSALVDFIDPDDASLNEVISWLIGRAADVGTTGVLVVDSVQTCRVDGGDAMETRHRIDAVVRTIKAAAAAGLLVVATSEVSRGFYRSSTDRIDPLAAFKESGSIEYALALGIVLSSVKGEVGQVDAYVPKNRMGRHSTSDIAFRLRLDFDRVKFAEVALPTDGDGEEYEHAEDPAEVERVANEIVRALLVAKGDITTRKDLERIVPRGQRVTFPAVALLIRTGRITGGRGKPFRVASEGGGK